MHPGDTEARSRSAGAAESDAREQPRGRGGREASETRQRAAGQQAWERLVDEQADDEPRTNRERVADLIEDRLDIPMAVLSVVWAGLIAYELIVAAPADWVVVLGNVIWGLFIVEFLTRLVVAGHPRRFLKRRWPSIFFLALPVLRIFRVVRAVRVLRALPAARVMGSSYRAIGTARSLLSGRIAFLLTTSAVVIFSGAQLFYLVEGEGAGRDGSFGDALWWTANAAISGNQVFEPETALGRLIAVVLSAYAVVVFAAVAAALGAFFIESRAERATVEGEEGEDGERAGIPVAGEPSEG